MRWLARWWALSLLLAAGCSRCAGPKSAASAEELLPQHPSGAVVTAPLSLVALHWAALSDRAASLPGGEQLGEARKAVAAQLGFDPLTRDGLLSAGLDPDRGAAVALLPGTPRPGWIVAFPLTRPDQFLATVQRLLVERAGFVPAAQQPAAAKVFGRGTSVEKIAVAVVRGYGLIARGNDPGALVSAPPVEQSLAREAGLSAARQKLGAQDLLVWAPRGSDLPKRFTPRPLPGDVSLGLAGSARGIATRFYAQLPPAESGQAQAALPGGGAALVELLPGNAFLRARLGVAPERFLQFVPEQLGKTRDALPKDLFAGLKPGVALSLAVARGANIGQAIDYGFDWRRKSPFDTVELVALAEVVDEKLVLRNLEAVAKAMPQLGARVQRKGNDFQIKYAGGRGARFGLHERLAYLLGGEIAPQDLRRTPRSTNPEAAALWDDPGAAVRIDFGKLSDALRALPETAYGSGPQAYVARSLVSQVIEPLRPVRVTLTAQAGAGFLGGGADVEIVAP
jgi:hypothetical protein